MPCLERHGNAPPTASNVLPHWEVAVTIPLALWLLLAALLSGIAPRERAARELERFLASENSSALAAKSNRAP